MKFRSLTPPCILCFSIISGLTVSASASAGQLEKIRESREIAIAHRDASIPFHFLTWIIKNTPSVTQSTCA